MDPESFREFLDNFDVIQNGNYIELLDKCVNLFNPKNGSNILHAVVAHTKQFPKLIDAIPLFVENSVDINEKNNTNNTPLHVALKYYHHTTFSTIKKLIENAASLSEADDDGWNSLHFASYLNEVPLEVVEYFFEKGSSYIYSKTNSGYTPLMLAVVAHNNELKFSVIKFIIEKCISLGLNINEKSNDGLTVLHGVCQNKRSINCKEILQILIDNGSDINAITNKNNTPLHMAVNQGENFEAIDFLVKNRADINAKGEYQNTPLLMAIRRRGELLVIKYLIENGASINDHNINGKTPLHIACKHVSDNFELVKYLIENHAPVNVFDHKMKTPIFFVKKYETFQVLIKNNATFHLYFKDESLLKIFMKGGNDSIVYYLLDLYDIANIPIPISIDDSVFIPRYKAKYLEMKNKKLMKDNEVCHSWIKLVNEEMQLHPYSKFVSQSLQEKFYKNYPKDVSIKEKENEEILAQKNLVKLINHYDSEEYFKTFQKKQKVKFIKDQLVRRGNSHITMKFFGMCNWMSKKRKL